MDFLPGIGSYSSRVHRIAVQAVLNCIKSGISDKSTQTGAFVGLGLGRHGVPSAMKVGIGHQTRPRSSRAPRRSEHKAPWHRRSGPSSPSLGPEGGFAQDFPRHRPPLCRTRRFCPSPRPGRREQPVPHLGNAHRCQRTCRPLLTGAGSPFLGARCPRRGAGLAFLSAPQPPTPEPGGSGGGRDGRGGGGSPGPGLRGGALRARPGPGAGSGGGALQRRKSVGAGRSREGPFRPG